MTITSSIVWTDYDSTGEYGWQSQPNFNTTRDYILLTHDLLEHSKRLLTTYRLNDEQHELTAVGSALELRVMWGIGSVTYDGLVSDVCRIIETFAYDDEPLESGLEMLSYVEIPACIDDQIVEMVKVAIGKYDIFDGSDNAIEIEDRIARLLYLGSYDALETTERVGTPIYCVFEAVHDGLKAGIDSIINDLGEIDLLWDGFCLDITISDDFRTVTVTPNIYTQYGIDEFRDEDEDEDEDEY